jgi:hypothetical protein
MIKNQRQNNGGRVLVKELEKFDKHKKRARVNVRNSSTV